MTKKEKNQSTKKKKEKNHSMKERETEQTESKEREATQTEDQERKKRTINTKKVKNDRPECPRIAMRGERDLQSSLLRHNQPNTDLRAHQQQ